MHSLLNRSILVPLALVYFFAALSAGAKEAPDGGFSMPLKCALDLDFWIINVPDAAGDAKALDHRCGFRTYNGHKRTDFAVRDFRAIDEGANVVAAAGWVPGKWKGEANLERFVSGGTITRRISVPLTVK